MVFIIKFYLLFCGVMIVVNMDGKYGMYLNLVYVFFFENFN